MSYVARALLLSDIGGVCLATPESSELSIFSRRSTKTTSIPSGRTISLS